MPSAVLRQQVDEMQVSLGVSVGFLFAHHRFTQNVEGESDLLCATTTQGTHDLAVLLAEHELMRHASDLLPDDQPEQSRCRPGRLQPEPEHRGRSGARA